jgi:hypothetical protein
MSRVLPFLFVALCACKTRRLPELPADRDPVSPEAPVTDYAPPPDVLSTPLSTGAGDAKDEHEHHHGHHGHEAAPAKPAEPDAKPAPGGDP